MKLFKKAKENKKGFTLVELIVVLVILAILIALLVPALTGYIDRARSKTVAAEARYAVTAFQAGAEDLNGDTAEDLEGDWVSGTDTKSMTDLLSNGNGNLIDGFTLSKVDTVTFTKNKVTHLEYTSGQYTATYDVEDNASTGTWKTVKN